MNIIRVIIITIVVIIILTISMMPAYFLVASAMTGIPNTTTVLSRLTIKYQKLFSLYSVTIQVHQAQYLGGHKPISQTNFTLLFGPLRSTKSTSQYYFQDP